MPSIDLQPTPRDGSFSQDPPAYTHEYVVTGEDNDSVIQAYALAITPTFVSSAVGVLYRQDLRIESNGFCNKTVTVPYGTKKKDTGSKSYRFDTTGGTAKITCAKEHIGTYDTTGTVAGDFHKGLIGVKPDGDIEGCDIIIPALKFSVDFKHPAGVVTIDYIKNLANNTGKTNNDVFLTFEVGELLFLGATGSDGTDADMEISYQFAASYNTSTLRIGNIQNINKFGWEYAWVESEADVVNVGGNDIPVMKPKYAHIERVYESCNFASVLGWS